LQASNGLGNGYLPPSQLKGLGERRKLHSRVRGGALAENERGAFQPRKTLLSGTLTAPEVLKVAPP